MAQSRQPVHLPLTASTSPAAAHAITVDTISLIVDDFYTRCRAHPILGPIFNRQVHDWDAHLAQIRAFWAAAILRTGAYSGRPLEAHRSIPNLAPAHFAIWLRLFNQTVSTHCTPDDTTLFMTLAGRMANRLNADNPAQPPPAADTQPWRPNPT